LHDLYSGSIRKAIDSRDVKSVRNVQVSPAKS
jgi:hypothetical protein